MNSENIKAEIEYYSRNRSKLSSNRKYLIDLYGEDGYEYIKDNLNTDVTYRQKFKTFKRKVWKITNKQPLHELENYEKRGWKDYHVDHIVSIFKAYKLGWTPSQCGHISNLQMLPYLENLIKRTKQ